MLQFLFLPSHVSPCKCWASYHLQPYFSSLSWDLTIPRNAATSCIGAGPGAVGDMVPRTPCASCASCASWWWPRCMADDTMAGRIGSERLGEDFGEKWKTKDWESLLWKICQKERWLLDCCKRINDWPLGLTWRVCRACHLPAGLKKSRQIPTSTSNSSMIFLRLHALFEFFHLFFIHQVSTFQLCPPSRF